MAEPVVTRVREARWTDVPALAALERELFPQDAWAEATWWAELAARPRRDYLVAEDPLGVVGYGGTDVGGEVADVMTVAVGARARGRGVGRRLLAALEGRAAARGAASVMLEVRADNAAALALYAAAGYTVISTRRRYYQPGDVDALVLRKLLQHRGVDDE